MDAFRTPPGYFEALPDRISARRRNRSMRTLRMAVAAVAASGVIAVGVSYLLERERACDTFACLLDATRTEELLQDDLLEELAAEPAAFDVLTEDL